MVIYLRILVIGSNGQLGRELLTRGKETDDIIGARRTPEVEDNGSFRIDLESEESIHRVVFESEADVVINAAAMTDVDGCERDPKMAELVNATAPMKISEACREIGSRMIQISTDYVFDGEIGMYNEEEDTSPIQEYGKSKLNGERAVIDILGSDAAIVRTSVVFSDKTNNFVTWVVESLRRGDELKIVDDQYVSPTSTKFLSDSALRLAEVKFSGIMNICSETRLSRIEMVEIISKHLELKTEKIQSINMSALEWVARRPKDSSLDCTKSKNFFPGMTFEEMLKDQLKKK